MCAAELRELAARLERAADEVVGEVMGDLRQAVRIRSVNPAIEPDGGEGAFQDWIAGVLDDLGCRVEAVAVDAEALAETYPAIRPFLGPSFAGRPNVVGRLAGHDDTPAATPARAAALATDQGGRASGGGSVRLLLNSHADTVAPGDTAAWSKPPFDGTLEDGAVWGLGAADAKGSLVTFLGALRTLRAAGVRLRRGLMVHSVVDEEAGGAGTLDLIRRGYTAEAAVVGEPTALRVCPGSRGAQDLQIDVVGRKAHTGEGWRGVNAAHLARRYIDALERLREELDRTAMHPLWRPLPVGHVWNLMALNTGPAARAVPDRCRIEYSVGTIGLEQAEAMRARVDAVLAAVTEGDPWLREHPPAVSWSPRVLEPAVTPADHEAVMLMAETGRTLGEAVRVEALSAATDGRYLTNVARVPTVNFGPGEMFRGHSPDERLPVEHLRRGVAWVALFIAAWCGVAPS
jgi:acetylornithine deacetylase